MTDSQAAAATTETRNGVLAGLAAYALWGMFPVYFKLIGMVSPVEVLTHRIVWAIPFGALIIYSRRQWKEVGHALTCRTTGFSRRASVTTSIRWFSCLRASS